jgi:subtilisin family serine protease
MDVEKALAFSLPLVSCLFVSACGYNMGNSSTGGGNKATDACAGTVVPNKYIVNWKDGTKSIEYAASESSLSLNLISSRSAEIDSVEHDYKVHVLGGLSKDASGQVTDQSSSTPDTWGQERAQAPDAWALAKGEGITVAVIDTGIDLNHSQLRNQLAVNAGEIASNGIDDDKNGFIDDVNGWNFIGGSRGPNVIDNAVSTHHGTHVSGIVLGEHVATMPSIKGMAPAAKLLPLSFLDDYGDGDLDDAVDAMNYAASRGAKIISASWGGEGCSKSLQNAVYNMEAKGVLFIAAAGNGDAHGIGYNLDIRQTYPAAYGAPGQITVGAIDSQNYMTSFSNFSRNLVHLMAPGSRIWSTVYDPGVSGGVNHGYALMDGTSMATPFVSGAAAVVWSYRPKATVRQVKAALIAGVTPGSYPVVSAGQLNVRKALDEIAKLVDP